MLPAYDDSYDMLLEKITDVQLKTVEMITTRGDDERSIVVRDSSDPCSDLDMIKCPLEVFRRTGFMQYTVDVSHEQFRDRCRFRVKYIRLVIKGKQFKATSSGITIRLLISYSILLRCSC